MFYIVREWHSVGGGMDMRFHSWYEYSIETSKPSSKECFVKVHMSKDDLKEAVILKGGLDEALEYLFNMARDDEEIERAFK